MARKRKHLQDVDYQSPEYWNKLLAAEGLSVDAGRSPRLIYAGSLNEVEKILVLEHFGDGRVQPKPQAL